MNNLRFLSVCLALVAGSLHGAELLTDVQMSGSNNQVNSGATFKTKSGATFFYEAGASFGGSVSEFRSDIGLAIGTDVQAYSANLAIFAGIAPSANVQSLLSAADYAAVRTQLGLVIGTNVQAYDADLTTFAGITPSANIQTFLSASDYAAMRAQLGLGTMALESASNYIPAPATPAEGDILYYNGTSWVRKARGTDGQVLKSTTTSIDWGTDSGGFANPMTTAGDLIRGGVGGAAERLGVGTNGQVLKVVGGLPTWDTDSTGSGTLPATPVAGDLVYFNGTDWVRLAIGTAAQVLTVNGGATAPQWSAPANGGTLTLARFTATENQPPGTNYATFDTRNSIAVLDFDATTAESAVFVGTVPEGADFTTGITVRLHWTATSATTGAVVWTSAFERGDTDLDTDSFATGIDSAAATTNATSGIATVTSIDHSGAQIDGLTAGDLFRVKITRKAADAADTMTGDAELIAVEIRQR